MRLFAVVVFLYSIQCFSENQREPFKKETPINCPTIDLTTKPPLSERKALMQPDLGWCCSYAFADALSMKFGKNYSPVDIAITHARAENKMEGCLLPEIPKAINESEGICLEDQFGLVKELPEKFNDIEAGKKKPTAQDFKEARDFMQKNSFAQTLSSLEDIWQTTQTDPSLRAAIICSHAPMNSPIFTNLNNTRDIGAVIQQSAAKDYYDFIYKLARKNCSSQEKLRFEYENIGSTRESIGEVFKALDSGKSPVFTLNFKPLFNYEPFNLKGAILRVSSAIRGEHAVNLVGVRPINGKCYVKVRDSAFGGDHCKGNERAGVLCAPKGKNDGTYELDVDAFIKYARYGIVIK